MNPVTITTQPFVLPLFEMSPIPGALDSLAEWVREYRPGCLDEGATGLDLFPHDGTEQGRTLTGNELSVELAGRTCYHSYGGAAGKKTNSEYIANTQKPPYPHRSVLYHAKVSFFVAGISRRLTHELIRHYVGADRDEEGSPSMESTRYTLHPGVFVVPPRVLDEGELDEFVEAMTSAYGLYRDYIDKAVRDFSAKHEVPPKGLDRKRIHEAAAGLLPGQAATSLYWTANPASLTKMFNERLDSSADLEFQRLIRAWKAVCVSRWPNLFQTA